MPSSFSSAAALLASSFEQLRWPDAPLLSRSTLAKTLSVAAFIVIGLIFAMLLIVCVDALTLAAAV